MVEIAKATDDEVGDGTTSVVVFAGKLLEKAQGLIDQNIHSTIIVDGFKEASEKALEYLKDIAVKVSPTDDEMLMKVAITTLSSKLVSGYSNTWARSRGRCEKSRPEIRRGLQD